MYYLFHTELIFQFPSPYGVSFILISKTYEMYDEISKYISVSLRSIIHSYIEQINLSLLDTMYFRLLAEYHSFLWLKIESLESYLKLVSVSLRSYIHSYVYTITNIKNLRRNLVSVSLRSIIYSYMYAIMNDISNSFSFRLLAEYYSFLC